MGRTGSFFAFEQLGVRPQLVTLAKALANGLPIGCLLVADEAAGAFRPGDHGSTFGGNPVVCAAAVAVCDTIDDELLQQVRANGERLQAGLAVAAGCGRRARRRPARRRRVREPGAADSSTLRSTRASSACRPGPNVLRLAPPLVASVDDVDRALEILADVTGR